VYLWLKLFAPAVNESASSYFIDSYAGIVDGVITIKHIDLFSGIGGFSLACDWAGIETICFCEMDKFCQKVLAKHWPNVPCIEDVNNVEEIKQVVTISPRERLERKAEGFNKWGECGQKRNQMGERLESNDPTITNPTATGLQELKRNERSNSPDATEVRTRMDNGFERHDSLLLTAGFPCQPFSNAGRKRGTSDDRYLWPQTLAVIEAVKPDWIILENVPGILNMVFPDSEVGVASQSTLFSVENDEICDYNTISGGIESDLRQAGYETVWLVIPACSLGAPHRRDRVWIVAQSVRPGAGSNKREITDQGRSTSENRREGIRQENGKVGTSGINSTDKHGVVANAMRNGNRQQGEGSGCSSQGKTDTQKQGQGRGQHTGQHNEQVELYSHAADTYGAGCQRQGQLPKSDRQERDSNSYRTIPGWSENWYEVATKFCRVDDGLPRVVDRVDRLKALGNAIVPAIASVLISNIKAIQDSDYAND